MIIGKGFYPYPVLSDFTDDYVSSIFDIDYNVETIGFESRYVKAEVTLEDEIIEDMIRKKEAILAIHLECPRTSYRQLYSLDKNQRDIEIEIDPVNMTNELQLSGVIVANKTISHYSNPNINKEFYGNNYIIRNLSEGDLIGATITQIIEIPMKADDFENISSIINVGESNDNLMSVNYDDDIIVIKLPEKEYESYFRLSGTDYSSIIMTSTILPSLVYILDMISTQQGQFNSELTWYKVIEDKLSTKDITIEDINQKISSIELAQMILEVPLKRALDDLAKIVEREG